MTSENNPASPAQGGSSSKPIVYLAGAFGFEDFKVTETTYGRYATATSGAEDKKRGLKILDLIEKDLQKNEGFDAKNPWTETVGSMFIQGVMFGGGKDADGQPWSEGSLKDKSLKKERLLYWMETISADPRLDAEDYAYSSASTYEDLEETYRNMVGDLIYSGNLLHVQNADVVFADLNAYRGDADDGTLFEVQEAIRLGKPVVILVDEMPLASLGEGIFGRAFRWNAMVSGLLRAHPEQVTIFHHAEAAVNHLLGWLAKRADDKA